MHALLGDIIGFFAPMNGGKTEGLMQELRRAWYYSLNTIAYNHERNTREKDTIVVDGKRKFKARTVSGMKELREDLEMRIDVLAADDAGKEVRGEKKKISKITHYRGFPLKVVGIDEINLFCLTEQEASDTLDFMKWCKSEKVALFVSGLLYDFRHFSFGYMNTILPYIDIKQEKKPACMALYDNGQKCTNTAKHTQRLWSGEFAVEQGLEVLVSGVSSFGFVDKEKKTVAEGYIPAPFFDKTVRIEEEKQNKVIYLPVCITCARLPFKEETFAVYRAIADGKTPQLENEALLPPITNFLLLENWMRREGEKYQALPYYRNAIGGFSPAG